MHGPFGANNLKVIPLILGVRKCQGYFERIGPQSITSQYKLLLTFLLIEGRCSSPSTAADQPDPPCDISLCISRRHTQRGVLALVCVACEKILIDTGVAIFVAALAQLKNLSPHPPTHKHTHIHTIILSCSMSAYRRDLDW
jgi:hypothetical protein